jgi:hypothetical protein
MSAKAARTSIRSAGEKRAGSGPFRRRTEASELTATIRASPGPGLPEEVDVAAVDQVRKQPLVEDDESGPVGAGGPGSGGDVRAAGSCVEASHFSRLFRLPGFLRRLNLDLRGEFPVMGKTGHALVPYHRGHE